MTSYSAAAWRKPKASARRRVVFMTAWNLKFGDESWSLMRWSFGHGRVRWLSFFTPHFSEWLLESFIVVQNILSLSPPLPPPVSFLSSWTWTRFLFCFLPSCLIAPAFFLDQRFQGLTGSRLRLQSSSFIWSWSSGGCSFRVRDDTAAPSVTGAERCHWCSDDRGQSRHSHQNVNFPKAFCPCHHGQPARRQRLLSKKKWSNVSLLLDQYPQTKVRAGNQWY